MTKRASVSRVLVRNESVGLRLAAGDQMADDQIQRRRFYRVNYPASERPLVTILKRKFAAIDVSEEGVRIALGKDGALNFKEGDEVSGVIDFSGRGNHQFKATVLRLGDHWMVLKLKTLIPLSTIMSEQRFLLQKFKSV